MLRVHLVPDPFDPSTVDTHTPADLVEFLREQFPVWPKTARLYRGSVSQETDVTPRDEAGAEALAGATGDYFVVVYPDGPLAIIAIAVAAVVALTVLILVLMPKIPDMSNDIASANNQLGSRTNKPRPNSRIPDIFGTVISVPDLLTYPIITFQDNVEVEVSYLCVGRGSYEINGVKDGGTPLTLIAGAGADFYGPGTSPNSGVPFYSVGAPIDDVPFREVIRLNEVNGQKLDPPDHNSVNGNDNIRFVAPNYIENNGWIDFTDYFGPGDDLTVSGADFGTSAAIIDATTQRVRFYADKRIEFDGFDPSTKFSAGQDVILQNAIATGTHATTGEPVFVDVSGQYVIDTVSATEIQLV